MSKATPGFEIGPIRPPNEAASLLVRVSRNCPWNRCTFCPAYKGRRFELRRAQEVQADIVAMAEVATSLASKPAALASIAQTKTPSGQIARFLLADAKTAFLQDANALITPVAELEKILRTLRECFPALERVTTYARSHTLTKRSIDELAALRDAGLDRVHVGLESGSDRVLALVDKGASAAGHIDAGQRVKTAGLQLSHYVMPGLGGKALSEEHAVETAAVLRAINPDFIRLRTLIIVPGTEMQTQRDEGKIEPLSDVEAARELRLLLAGLEGVCATIRSDHSLNLLEEIDGQLPEDLPRLLAVVDGFLSLPQRDQELFIVGRRLGILGTLSQLDEPRRRAAASEALSQIRARYDGPLDEAIRQVIQTFV